MQSIDTESMIRIGMQTKPIRKSNVPVSRLLFAQLKTPAHMRTEREQTKRRATTANLVHISIS